MVKLRIATPDDAVTLADIYNYYVENTNISYEYAKVSYEDFKNRIIEISKAFPYIVAYEDNKIIGYAYSHSFRERKAFSWGTELSMYLDKNCKAKGTGTMLMEKILSMLKSMNFVIAYSFVDEPNPASTALHEKFGFEKVATLNNTGFKNGKWCSAYIYELVIGNFDKPNEIDRDWQKYF
ncbi:MAG: N-acetyltransferase family protein [Clostridia bacterium]